MQSRTVCFFGRIPHLEFVRPTSAMTDSFSGGDSWPTMRRKSSSSQNRQGPFSSTEYSALSALYPSSM